MHIFPTNIEIGETEGFDSGKDIFGLKPFGEGLTALFSKSADPIVLALDGPWGSGKSTFVKMWAGHLRSAGFPVIYFDAFENDYVGDGFVALAGEVASLSKNSKAVKAQAYDSFITAASKTGRVFVRGAAKVAVRGLTAGVIDIADLSLGNLGSDAEKEINQNTDKYFEVLLRDRDAEKSSIGNFKKALTEVVSILNEGTGKPLIFIVDELDRCKPTFALDMVEKIKHIFSVPKVHFVLVTHLRQLETSVKFAYGSNTDARVYLQKFYNLIFYLPMNGRHAHEQAATRLLNLIATNSLSRDLLDMVKFSANANGYSLRTIERIVTYINLVHIFTTKKDRSHFRPPAIVAGLAIAKAVDPDLFLRAKNGHIQSEEILKMVCYSEWPQEHPKAYFGEYWKFATDDEIAPGLERFGQGEFFHFSNRKDIVRSVANSIIDRMVIPDGPDEAA